jgi:hypothetical protein
MMRLFSVLIIWWGFGTAALAAPAELVSRKATDVAVTIYTDNLALVTETRDVDLPGGPVKIVFEGVLDQVIPQSAVLQGLEKEERERNFDFDGLTPQSLLYRSLGEKVSLVRQLPDGTRQREEATIASAGDGIALQFDDHVEWLGCSGLPERLIFSRLPPNLRARPALSTLVSNVPPGRYRLTLSYLATGMEWKANYVVRLDSETRKADVTGWITIENSGEEGFARARIAVVAGELSRLMDAPSRRLVQQMAKRNCVVIKTTSDVNKYMDENKNRRMRAEQIQEIPMSIQSISGEELVVVVTAQKRREDLADYKLYRLGHLSSLPAQQIKQFQFLHREDIRDSSIIFSVYLPLYEMKMNRKINYSNVELIIPNKKDNGFGVDLPAGEVLIFVRRDGHDYPAYLTEGNDVAIGNEWHFDELGILEGVTVTPRLISERRRVLPDKGTLITQEVEASIKNEFFVPIEVELEPEFDPDLQRVLSANIPWRRGYYGGPVWRFTLKAGESRRLLFTLEERSEH